MSFRLRLTFFYATILTGFFLCFGLISFLISRQTLISALDTHLEESTLSVLNETNVRRVSDELAVLRFPEDMGMFQAAALFMIAIDVDGNVIARSTNLNSFEGLLDDRPIAQFGMEPEFSTVTHFRTQRLRVLTYPLLIEDQNGNETLVGYIQMAELMDNYLRALDQLGAILMIIGGFVFIFFLALTTRTTHNLLKPLDEITSVSLQITGTDDLSRRVPDYGRKDEIGKLSMALNETFERLEKLFRAQQRLLADVSHELRTPLTAVRGNIDLMRSMGEMDEESLDIIQDELERMTRLVGDLLLLARADGGSKPLRWQTHDLDTIVLDVYKQITPLSKENAVKLNLAQIHPIRIHGDGDRLKQLLLILVDNAIKYTPAGGRVDIGLERDEAQALITITDTGLGIAPEHLPNIFDRFYRVDKARSRAMGGSGLGLSIAKWITEAHHGRISVSSEVGRGTTFVIWLPALPDLTQSDETSPEPKEEVTRPIRVGRIPIPGLRAANNRAAQAQAARNQKG